MVNKSLIDTSWDTVDVVVDFAAVVVVFGVGVVVAAAIAASIVGGVGRSS